jgi:hypothetical protein
MDTRNKQILTENQEKLKKIVNKSQVMSHNASGFAASARNLNQVKEYKDNEFERKKSLYSAAAAFKKNRNLQTFQAYQKEFSNFDNHLTTRPMGLVYDQKENVKLIEILQKHKAALVEAYPTLLFPNVNDLVNLSTQVVPSGELIEEEQSQSDTDRLVTSDNTGEGMEDTTCFARFFSCFPSKVKKVNSDEDPHITLMKTSKRGSN